MPALAPLLFVAAFAPADPPPAGAGVPGVVVAGGVTVVIPMEDGRLYQVQRRTDVRGGDEWEDVGVAVRGTGGRVVRHLPAGRYRVVRPGGWALVWRDEFGGTHPDGTGLDLTKWAREENNYGGGNFERQAYRADDKYNYVRDGKLHVSVYRDPHTTSDGKTQPYSSARLRTRGRGDWRFGRVEVRAKMPAGQGIWPAVWMLPTDSPYGAWAAGGEIDLLESRGSAVHETTGALHFGGPWPRNTYLAHAYRFPGENAAEAFHTYAVEWDAEKIVWFVDGTPVKTRTADEWFTEAAPGRPSAPFDTRFHLIVNVAVDGRFFEKTDQRADRLPDAAFPQTLLIDWVRVYQKDRGPRENEAPAAE